MSNPASGRRVPVSLIVAACGVLPGCMSQHKPDLVVPVVPQVAPPTAEQIARVYNTRVEGLRRLWSRLEMKFTGTDAQGKPIDEESEGFFITEPPFRLSMSVNKLGEAYFLLGSNQERYWWFDLSRPERPAYVGLHANATPEKTVKVGLPVHPLELLELVACTPITPDAPDTPAISTAWATDAPPIAGRTLVVVTSPTRWGVRRVYVDPSDGNAHRVVLADEQGRTLVESELSRYEPVAGTQAAVATVITLRLAPSGRGTLTVRMTLYGMEDRDLNPALFDLEEQKSRRDVRKVFDLDGPSPAVEVGDWPSTESPR